MFYILKSKVQNSNLQKEKEMKFCDIFYTSKDPKNWSPEKKKENET